MRSFDSKSRRCNEKYNRVENSKIKIIKAQNFTRTEQYNLMLGITGQRATHRPKVQNWKERLQHF